MGFHKKQKNSVKTRELLTEIDQAIQAPGGHCDGFWSFRGEDATAHIPVNGPVSPVVVDRSSNTGVYRSTNIPVHYRSTNMPVDTGPQIPVDNGTDPLIQVSNTEPGARPSLPRVTYEIADMSPPSPLALTEPGDCG